MRGRRLHVRIQLWHPATGLRVYVPDINGDDCNADANAYSHTDCDCHRHGDTGGRDAYANRNPHTGCCVVLRGRPVRRYRVRAVERV
jgi:hypothetical protein